MIGGFAGGGWVRPAARPLEGTIFWGEIIISTLLFAGGIALMIVTGWLAGVVLAFSALGFMGLSHSLWLASHNRFAIRSDGFSLWVRSDAGAVRQLTPGDVAGISRRYIHRLERDLGDVVHCFLIVHDAGARCLVKLQEDRWKHGDLEEICRVLGHPHAWPGEIKGVTKRQLVREFSGALTLSERHPVGFLTGFGVLGLTVVALIMAFVR